MCMHVKRRSCFFVRRGEDRDVYACEEEKMFIAVKGRREVFL